jgi:anti-anti-sigma factor
LSDGSAGISRTATLANLEDLRSFVENAGQTAALDREVTYALKLAADEICSNIIEHGYRGMAEGPIEITLSVNDEEACLVITDRGHPFPPEGAGEPNLDSDWATRPVGGLGWHLVRQVVDRFEYSTDPVDGNRLRLYKHLPASQNTETQGEGMDITVEHQNSSVVVKVTGSIDSLTAANLSEALSKEIEAGARQMVVDMSGVDYTSSAGLRALLGSVKLARHHGGDFRLAGVQKFVFKVLELSGFTSILKSFDSVDEALASFDAPSADSQE